MKNKFEIPPHLKHLPVDGRGFPVPYVVFVDKAGTPHFKVNDRHKDRECFEKRWCHVCGLPLKREFWFIGGQISAYHPNGAFNDGPVHKACGEFALKVCPYLAYTQYKAGGITASAAEHLKSEGIEALYDPTQMMERLPFFCFVQARDFKVNVHHDLHGITTTSPVKPYLQVEYWKDGQRIHRAEAIQLLKNNNEKIYL